MRRERARFGELFAWFHLDTAVAGSHFTSRLNFLKHSVVALACLSYRTLLQTSCAQTSMTGGSTGINGIDISLGR